MQTLGVVFTPLNRCSADKKKRISFFQSSLTYFSFIKIGGEVPLLVHSPAKRGPILQLLPVQGDADFFLFAL